MCKSLLGVWSLMFASTSVTSEIITLQFSPVLPGYLLPAHTVPKTSEIVKPQMECHNDQFGMHYISRNRVQQSLTLDNGVML